MLLLLVGVVASRQASQPIHAAEREARPRVILNAAQIHKRTSGLPAESIQHAVRIYDYLARINQPLQWEGRSVNLVNAGETLELRLSPAGSVVRIPLPGIDYINFVDAAPLRMGSSASPVLALLITGRATGRRDLIAIVSEAGELVYLELLDRTWNFRSVSLAISASPAGDLILVGSEPQDLLLFAPQAAP
jgi:hypothetical protein